MIAYFDASALVKRYLVERGSRETIALTAESEMIATSVVTRAEVAAAFAKAARTGLVTVERARKRATIVRGRLAGPCACTGQRGLPGNPGVVRFRLEQDVLNPPTS